MSSTATNIDRQSWEGTRLFSRPTLGRMLRRFGSAHFRKGSFYTSVRMLTPLFWLAGFEYSRVHAARVLGLGPLMAHSETVRHLLIGVCVLAIWNVWLGFQSFDRHSRRGGFAVELGHLLSASSACGVFLLSWEIADGSLGRGIVLSASAVLGLIGTSCVLLAASFVAVTWHSRSQTRRTAVIVGTGRRAELLKTMLQHDTGIRLCGCVDDEDLGSGTAEQPYLGPISELAEILKNNPIEVVYVGLPMRSKFDEIQRVLAICETVGVEMHFMREIFDTTRARVQVHSQVPRDFNVVSSFTPHPKQWIKRGIDLVGGSLLLILFSPVMLAAALAVALSDPGPVFFRQQRFGLNRKPFPMYKFRSMVVDAERQQHALEAQNEAQGPVFKLRRDPRLTRVGAVLRKTSIDELPQLLNVLRGEMSLVGPRPLPQRDVSRFSEPWLLRRFSVRPGLTCIWQVNGRSDTSFDDWIRQDLDYIDRWSLSLDLNILVRTVPAVLRGRGAA